MRGPTVRRQPRPGLGVEHCAAVFDRADRINAVIQAQRAEGKEVIRPEDDVRERPKVIGTATRHRIFAALRTVLNFEVKVTHRLTFNPVYAVQLEPEERDEAERWTAAESDRFLAACEGDPLALMFRVAVLRGTRRGELVGFRWSASDLDAGYLGVGKTILQLGGTVVFEDKAKTAASKRRVWLDDETIAMLHEHRKAAHRAAANRVAAHVKGAR
jgi:integrase